MTKAYQTFVDGQWLHTDHTMEVINKFTGELLPRCPWRIMP